MIPLSKHGWKEMLIGTLVLGVLGSLLGWLWWPLSVLVLPVWVWLIAFFRDPNRPLPAEANTLVSPADGTVTDITPIENHPDFGGPAVSVGIFLSVFNVHVNRTPWNVKVLESRHKPGKFIDARDTQQVSLLNEANDLLLGDVGTGKPLMVVRQISGLIARRIICTAKPGDVLHRGERFGLIKFGSRTELILPMSLKPEIRVKLGQKVSGASDVIATFSPET